MWSKSTRRLASIAGIAAAAVAAVAVALPFVASNQIVRDRVAQELSSWSGFEVTISGDPEIEVWPRFRAILRDVDMRAPGGSSPTVEAERMEIELSALSALRGEAVFSEARLVRPTLIVDQGENGMPTLPLPAGGRIARAIEAARVALAEKPLMPDRSRLSAEEFGSVDIVDGRIVVGRAGDRAEAVGDVSGRIEWEALNDSGRLSLAGLWRGEKVALELEAQTPILMFAGGSSPVSMAVKSSKSELAFEGTAALMGNAFLDGQASLAAQSLRPALEWLSADPVPAATAGPASLSGHLMASRQRLKLENTELALDGNAGHGAIEVGIAETAATVSGTLAFETLDLTSFLYALTPGQVGAADESLFDRLRVDLRLSARQARAGTVTLTDVAATARMASGIAAFDISDATAFGGDVQAGLHFDRTKGTPIAEIRMLASGVEGASFASALGMSRMVPAGTGTVSVILKGPGEAWSTMLEQASGSVSARFGRGSLSGFDIDAFVARTAEGGFFSLDEVASGSFAVDGVDIRASISDGVAQIEKAEAWSSSARIRLSGVVPYLGRGLALSGQVLPGGNGSETVEPEALFFVGGSWGDPFVSPARTDSPAFR